MSENPGFSPARIEAAARAIDETAVISMGDYAVMNQAEVALAVLTAAFPEIASGEAWVAPRDITIGMFRDFVSWLPTAPEDVQFVFAGWMNGTLSEDWNAMRDAYVKERGE